MRKVSLMVALLALLAGPALHAEEEGVGAKVGRGIEKGAQAAGNGIEKGAQAAGKGIEKGADATSKGVNKAVDATGHFFQKADAWIDGKLHKKGASAPAGGDK